MALPIRIHCGLRIERQFTADAVYCLRDREWGGAFWKTNAYAPYPIWLWLNGHEWAKRQLEKAGIAYEALDNGFRSCADPVALQRICDRLGSRAIWDFFRRWVVRLPLRFRRDILAAAYRYDLAFGNSRSPTPWPSTVLKPGEPGSKR